MMCIHDLLMNVAGMRFKSGFPTIDFVMRSTEYWHEYEPRHGDYQQCGILTSVDSDEPVQPPI